MTSWGTTSFWRGALFYRVRLGCYTLQGSDDDTWLTDKLPLRYFAHNLLFIESRRFESTFCFL